MYYRLSVPQASYSARLLSVLAAEMADQAEARDLLGRLESWLRTKGRQDIQGKPTCTCDVALETS
jgi:hypothetical protein